jgi:hypothetical protein
MGINMIDYKNLALKTCSDAHYQNHLH